MSGLDDYLLPPISNGNAVEQALIRRWWHEIHGARGRIVWEYFLQGLFADAVWFPDAAGKGLEEAGQRSRLRFPINGSTVVLAEAKSILTPELIGQALVYSWYARKAEATVSETILLSLTDPYDLREAAISMGLSVLVEDIGFSAFR